MWHCLVNLADLAWFPYASMEEVGYSLCLGLQGLLYLLCISRHCRHHCACCNFAISDTLSTWMVSIDNNMIQSGSGGCAHHCHFVWYCWHVRAQEWLQVWLCNWELNYLENSELEWWKLGWKVRREEQLSPGQGLCLFFVTFNLTWFLGILTLF